MLLRPSVLGILEPTLDVQNGIGDPLGSKQVYAYDGAGTWYSGTTDESGQAVFMLLPGSYQFLAMVGGVGYWSEPTTPCVVPTCTSYTQTVPVAVTLTLQNANGDPLVSKQVYAYDGVSTWYSGITDGSGQAVFMMMPGSYRFAAVVDDVVYWSEPSPTITIPGSTGYTFVITPVGGTLKGSNSLKQMQE